MSPDELRADIERRFEEAISGVAAHVSSVIQEEFRRTKKKYPRLHAVYFGNGGFVISRNGLPSIGDHNEPPKALARLHALCAVTIHCPAHTVHLCGDIR